MAAFRRKTAAATAAQQFLYLAPDPHVHGLLRGGLRWDSPAADCSTPGFVAFALLCCSIFWLCPVCVLTAALVLALAAGLLTCTTQPSASLVCRSIKISIACRSEAHQLRVCNRLRVNSNSRMQGPHGNCCELCAAKSEAKGPHAWSTFPAASCRACCTASESWHPVPR